MRRYFEDLSRVPALWVVASIGGVASFALAQPLFDLLGRNPEFFIARRFPAGDIVLLAVALVLLPVLLAIPPLVARRFSRAAAGAIHAVVFGALVGVVAATVLVILGLSSWPPAVFFTAVAILGVAASWLFVRFSPVRTGFVYLGFAPLVFAVWFLYFTSVAQLVRASSAELPEAGAIANPVPVVMVVFDEFPEASIMHADGTLDSDHYPNFARLAADGVWYRNAVGVRQQTEEALPSIMTGHGVSLGSIPTLADHPFNIFTLLSEGYDVKAVESVTDMCPPFVCSNTSRPLKPLAERWSAVTSDLEVVYGHLTLPKAMSDALPAIDQTWGGFDQPTAEQFDIIERFLNQVDDDRRKEVGRFVATFDDLGDKPPLRFAHFLYPHHPWDLTADGKVHGAPTPPGRYTVGWGPDDYLVAQGWQRHLIQTQWADHMLGSVLDKVKQTGIYDQALILVVADHGITIHPNTEHQRVITPETIGSVASVPMFVKYPSSLSGAPSGVIDDLHAETTDLLPTIADVVGVNVPWKMDGVSLLDTEARADRSSSVMLGSKGPVTIPNDETRVEAVAAEKESWFPDGEPYALAPRGWEGLLGLNHVSGSDDPDVRISVAQASALAAYTPGDDRVPSYLSGSIVVPGNATGQEILAVTVDGTVAAVTRTFGPQGSSASWEAMIDPHLLDSGHAQVEVWQVTGSLESPAFIS